LHLPLIRKYGKLSFIFCKKYRTRIFQDFSDLDEAADKMQVADRLTELVTDEQRESQDPFINDEQANIIFSCYALMNMGLLGTIFGENPFELLSKAKRDIHRKLRILNHAKKIDPPLVLR